MVGNGISEPSTVVPSFSTEVPRTPGPQESEEQLQESTMGQRWMVDLKGLLRGSSHDSWLITMVSKSPSPCGALRFFALISHQGRLFFAAFWTFR